MPLFVRNAKAVLYVHVPKTGGSSIEQFFLANGFRAEFLDNTQRTSLNRYRRCSPQHMTAEQLLHVLRPSRIDHIFMTVREPMARLVSEYRMHRRVNQEAMPLETWVRHSFRRYADEPYMFDNHIRPQADFWLPGCDVHRQEDGFGEVFVAGLEERLGLVFESRVVRDVNRGEPGDLAADEQERIRPLVSRFYRQDYVQFAY